MGHSAADTKYFYQTYIFKIIVKKNRKKFYTQPFQKTSDIFNRRFKI